MGRTRTAVRITGVAVGAVLGASVITLGAGAAQAADGCVKHPKESSVVCVRENNTVVDICDRQQDTNRVYGRIELEGFTGYLVTAYDQNGANSGCGHDTVRGAVAACGCSEAKKKEILRANPRISGIAVCTQNQGCSQFKRVL